MKSNNLDSFIENDIKQYKNIKIIFNNETKGMLYSYTIGVLNTKGEYILILKTGETLATDNVINEIYNKVKYTNYDILEFNLLISNNNIITENSLKLYRCPHIKSTMNFDTFKYNKNEIGFDQEKELISNKIIKSSFFKKIIYKYNNIFINEK